MNDASNPANPGGSEAVQPGLTPASIAAVVRRQDYHVFPGTTLTVCCLTLRNGFHVTGESACASPAFFNEAKGREIARANAVQKIWALEGYLLRQMLHVAAIERMAQQIRGEGAGPSGESRTEQATVVLREASERGLEASVEQLLRPVSLAPTV
jgi:hypothetical protein